MADAMTNEQHELLELARRRLENLTPEQREVLRRGQARSENASGSQGAAFLRGGATGLTNLTASIPGLPVSLATTIGEYGQNNPHLSAAVPGIGLFTALSNVIPRNDQGAPVGGSTDLAQRARGWVNEQSLNVNGPSVTYDTIDSLPPDERAAAVAGETVFPNLLAGAGLLRTAQALMGSNALRNAPGWVQGAVNSMGQNPGTARTMLGLESAGAGVGAGVAESQDPGNFTRRLAYELIGGITAPMSPVVRTGQWLGNQGRRVASGFSPAAADTSAVETIRRAFQDAGEDVNSVIPMLMDESGVNSVLTSGQRTGSPVLLAIEAKIARETPAFGARAERGAQKSLEELRTTIDGMVESGDPAQLHQAATLRRQYFERIMDETLGDAQRRAQAVIDELGPEPTQAARQAASAEADQIINQAHRQARRVEEQLWDEGLAALPDAPMPATATSEAYRQVRRQMRESVSLPDNLDTDLRHLIDDEGGGGMMNPLQLRILRSDILDAARVARGNGNVNLAGKLDQLASAALDDLMELGGESLNDARAYSTQLNDNFTRDFGSRATGVNDTGGVILQPETMLDTAFSGRNSSVNARQLQEGAEFGGEAAPRIAGDQTVRVRGSEVPVDPSLGPRMQQAQEDFLRNASQLVRNADGTIDANKLSRFLRDNEVTLQRFPELRTQLANAESATRAFDNIGETVQAARQGLEQTAFARVAGFENATDGVESVLGGRFPVRDYRELARVAVESGDDAVAGLRSATLDAVRRKSTGPSGQFSFSRFREELMTPRAQGQPTVLQMMERDGVISADMAERMRTALQQADRIEVALSAPGRAADLIENPSAFVDFILRVKGAAIGGDIFRLAGGNGPGSLVAAGAGSQAVRNVMNKIPNGNTMAALQRMMEQPRLLAEMLRNTDSMTPAEAVRHARTLESLLTRAGLITARSTAVEQHSDGEMQLDNNGG